MNATDVFLSILLLGIEYDIETTSTLKTAHLENAVYG